MPSASWSTPTANLANVTIRNCRIDGFFHAIDLVRNGANRLAAGHEYDNYLRNVLIEDTASAALTRSASTSTHTSPAPRSAAPS